MDEHINLSHAQRLEAFVRGPDRHVLRLPQMALDVCGSRGPGDESHTALCQGQKRGCAEPGPNAALIRNYPEPLISNCLLHKGVESF